MLTLGLPPAHVITVMLALRRLRANHKHTTRAVLRFVLEHPRADSLIAARRPALADCFEHALGKATARGCARRIAEGDTGSEYLRRQLLRFLAYPAAAPPRVRALYAVDAGPGGGDRPDLEPALALEVSAERPAIVTTENRGDIAATLVRLYQGGPAGYLHQALESHLAAATAGLPRMHGRLTLVLDTSVSMRGHGDREWAAASQAEALRLVLGRVCDTLTVIEVGGGAAAAGRSGPPTARIPHGATDLATGLLDALETAPDLVAIVSDGYENVLPGDLARVTATLRHIRFRTPVVFCQALFTGGDDVALRSPDPALPRRAFWRQDDFADLLPWMFAHCATGSAWVRTVLRGRLDDLEGAAARLRGGPEHHIEQENHEMNDEEVRSP